jgi:hypothetical protein
VTQPCMARAWDGVSLQYPVAFLSPRHKKIQKEFSR